MGFYTSWLFPRVLDLVMQQRQLIPFRRRIGQAASGRVLDVGIGSGLNLPFYSEQTERVIGIDPSPDLLHFAKERAGKTSTQVELLQGSGEEFPIEDKSIDTVCRDLHLVHSQPGARGDAAGAQTRRPASFRRTWPRTGGRSGPLARQGHAGLETSCWRLSSQPQAG
jgi:SAM-dependent methyltransferase